MVSFPAQALPSPAADLAEQDTVEASLGMGRSCFPHMVGWPCPRGLGAYSDDLPAYHYHVCFVFPYMRMSMCSSKNMSHAKVIYLFKYAYIVWYIDIYQHFGFHTFWPRKCKHHRTESAIHKCSCYIFYILFRLRPGERFADRKVNEGWTCGGDPRSKGCWQCWTWWWRIRTFRRPGIMFVENFGNWSKHCCNCSQVPWSTYTKLFKLLHDESSLTNE